MALINCDFFSETLGFCCSMTVILPQKTSAQIGLTGKAGRSTKFPVLYLLHGSSDDHTIWLRRTSIERYVAPMGLAVVMPCAHISYYTDMKYGGKYWTFVSQELPALVKSFFPISDRREDTFAAGLSMGGYGAFKLGLSLPEQFAAAASLSGVMDVQRLFDTQDNLPGRQRQRLCIFGEKEKIAGSDNDLFRLADKLAKRKDTPRPKLFQCCGTEDFLYQDNLQFRDHLQKRKFDLTYTDGPGTHEWGYWDANIQKVLAWLPLKK